MTPSVAGRRLPYIGALDGLRALAVLAVLHYHLDAPAAALRLRGGFYGVDVFFVLSGYLITSLLLSEWREGKRVGLRSFWLRRARRLLPAVLFLLGAVLAYALVFLPDEVAALRSDATAALAYVTNWYLIFQQQSYFESWGRPSLFQHLWSLAIEEQFYLIWPLLFVVGMRFLRAPGMLMATLGAAVGATVLMAVLYEPGSDPSRVYYGTDTRSTGLLIGSALAIAMPLASQSGLRRRRWRDAAGVLGLGALAYFIVGVGDNSALTYRGGFLIVSLATAAVVAALVDERSLPGRALGGAALRTVGTRSYSIYLWHWPVFMLMRPGLDVPFAGWPLAALQLAVVALLAEASYRFIEMPVRSGVALQAWRRWRQALTSRNVRQPALSLGVAATVLLVVALVAVMRADGPASISSSSSIGIDVPPAVAAAGPRVERSAESPVGTVTPPPTTPRAASGEAAPVVVVATQALGSLHCTSGEGPDAPPICGTPTPTSRPKTPSATATPLPPPRITALGDSVMLGASAQLSVGLETADIHARVGMQASEGTSILRQLRDTGALGDVVVVHLGNNGQFNAGQVSEMMEELRAVPLVIFVNLKVPRDWQENNNHMLSEAVGSYPNARLIDWHAQSKDEPQYFWNDGIHLRLEGAFVYTALIIEEIRAVWYGASGHPVP